MGDRTDGWLPRFFSAFWIVSSRIKRILLFEICLSHRAFWPTVQSIPVLPFPLNMCLPNVFPLHLSKPESAPFSYNRRAPRKCKVAPASQLSSGLGVAPLSLPPRLEATVLWEQQLGHSLSRGHQEWQSLPAGHLRIHSSNHDLPLQVLSKYLSDAERSLHRTCYRN